MIAIPATEKRLRAAHFFLRLLQARDQQLHTDPEEFGFLVGAFLSAAYSVENALNWERGQAYQGWVTRWWTARRADDQSFHDYMTGERHAEVHHEGVTVRREQETIPYEEYQQRRWPQEAGRRRGRIEVVGPVGTEIPHFDVLIDILKLGNEKAAQACERYFDLLKQVVQAFRETTAEATERQQEQARMRDYKIWLDPESQALVRELRRPGEPRNALVARALHALHERQQSDRP
jgi:hypothetical protein